MPLTFYADSARGLHTKLLIFIYSLTYIKAAFFITVHGLTENLSPYYYKSRF